MKALLSLLMLVLVVSLMGCGGNGPVPIHYGTDQCDNCRMNIVDNRFGSETITSTNKIYKFDSIECMAAYNAHMAQSSEIASSLWVTDFYNPESFLSLASSTLIRTAGIRSPMGLGFAATSSDTDARKFISEYGGETLNWGKVSQIVAESWSNGH